MITEFIDGLQQFHFLQKRLYYCYRHRNCCWCGRMLHYFARHVSHGRCHLTRGPSRGGFVLYPGYQFLYWRHYLRAFSFHPHHLYQEQLHHQERHCDWDYLFFFPRLRVILIGVAKSSTDLFHILFGNILAVQDQDMWMTIGIGVAVLLVIVLLFRPLLLTSFDPVLAQSMGVRVKAYHYLLMVLLTLVSVTAMQSVGTILIVAMLITPAATAISMPIASGP